MSEKFCKYVFCSGSQDRKALDCTCPYMWDASAKPHLFRRGGDMLQDLAAKARAVSNDGAVNVAVLVLGAVAAGAD